MVYPPFASNTACILSGILFIKPPIVSCGIFSHFTTACSNSSCALWGLCSVSAHIFLSRRFTIVRKFSMGLRSGGLGGQGSYEYPESLHNLVFSGPLYYLAPSATNIRWSRETSNDSRNGIRCGSWSSEVYCATLSPSLSVTEMHAAGVHLCTIMSLVRCPYAIAMKIPMLVCPHLKLA